MVDKETKDKLLDLIRKSREQELLFLRTIRDAAILAGEQVQDKRLDFLENPPDVNATSFLLDFLIELALGPLANVLIGAFTKWGLKKILKSRGLYVLKDTFENNADNLLVLILSRHNAPVPLAQALVNKKKKEYKLWKVLAESLAKIEETGVATTAKRLQSPSTSQKINNLQGDTASVAVRRAALSFVRLQEPAVDLIHDYFKKLVESDEFPFTPEKFIHFLNIDLKYPKSIFFKENDEIEKSLSLFFEACIWIMYFGGSGKIKEQATKIEMEGSAAVDYYPVPSPPRRVLPFPRTVLSFNKPFAMYGVKRFPHPKGDGSESFLLYATKNNLNTRVPEAPSSVFFPSPYSALKDLLEWFKNIEDGVVNLQQFGVVGLDVFGPIKPK